MEIMIARVGGRGIIGFQNGMYQVFFVLDFVQEACLVGEGVVNCKWELETDIIIAQSFRMANQSLIYELIISLHSPNHAIASNDESCSHHGHDKISPSPPFQYSWSPLEGTFFFKIAHMNLQKDSPISLSQHHHHSHFINNQALNDDQGHTNISGWL